MTFHPSNGETVPIGDVKILQRGRHRTSMPAEFESLPDDYVSLGQSESYYQALEALGAVGEEVLRALRDLTLPSAPSADPVSMGAGVEKSLLRFPDARKVYALRLNKGNSGAFSFRYRYRFKTFANVHELEFQFDPRNSLGRINVMVGENATGKTSVLGRLAFALSGTPAEREIEPVQLRLAPILAVSFSPFDDFRRPEHSNPLYEYIGIRKHETSRPGESERPPFELDIAGAFRRLDVRAEEIRERGRVDVWLRALRACGIDNEITQSELLSSRMLGLSAGQKFAVFVFTNLVAKIESRAMVLFDEPELHTHPRLLSGMMRALSHLLHELDAYAIVATHSPILLQEVPARSIRIFGRRDDHVRVDNYAEIHGEESFGAPLDQIVRRAFGVAREDRNFIVQIMDSAREGGEGLEVLESLLTGEHSMTVEALLRRYRRDRS